jgi:outer membrane protein assembly factor BamB
VLFGGDADLECVDVARGGVLWKAELALPGNATGSPFGGRSYVESNPRYAILDGQTLVVNAGEALFGVGMITGRRLWARRYNVRLNSEIAAYRDGAMAGGDGYVAALPRDGYLSLLRTRDGSTVWERDLRGESIWRVWMRGDRILTADAAMTRAHVFDRADGRLVRRALFAQPNPGAEVVSLVSTGGVLCGPGSDGPTASVVGVDTRSGKDVWALALSKPVAQLFEVAPGHLGMGMLGGEVKIVDVETGEVLLSYQVPQGRATVAGAYFEGSLILAVESLRGSPSVPSLVALDIATGEQLWVRDDIQSLPNLLDGLSIVDGVIPAFVQFKRTSVEQPIRTPQGLQTGLAFIDPRTGGTLGEKAPLQGVFSGSRVGTDLAIHGEFAIVGTNNDIRAYRVERARADDGGGL